MDLPELVPARIVNEYIYCPRLAYLEWVQGVFEDSADTVDGRFKHRVVDEATGTMPPPEGVETPLHARSVWLSSPEENLTTRIDLLEASGQTVTPVDYKRGSAPNTPTGAWEPDRAQLAAQALVLRANGYTCHEGVLYYIESKTRVLVPMDDALITSTRYAVQAVRALAASRRIPPPLEDSPKCPRCSLAGLCLPDETRLLAVLETPEPATPPPPAEAPEEDRVRRLMPARDDAMPLYVQEQGARVTKSGEVWQAWRKDELLGESRIFETSHIALMGNVQITTQALSAALDEGVPVAFFTMGGWFKGWAHGPTHKNVELRLAQYQTALDEARSLKVAQALVVGKIRNCRTLLMRNHPNLPGALARQLADLAKQAQRAPNPATLLGLEALAAKLYFGAFPALLKPKTPANATWRFDFEGRNRRPPRDPVNALLSYAYSLLAKEFTLTALLTGFDPLLGFFHQPRYGRPSLALDLMEEFRPVIADSVVLTVINNGIITLDDFVQRGPAASLTPTGRKAFLRAYEQRLDTLISHPIFGYRVSYRRVLEVQTRLLARHLLGEIPAYPNFLVR